MNKKQKQLIGIGAVIVIVIILIIAFSGGNTPASVGTNLPNPNTLGEKEKYAMFSAEVACELVNVMKDLDEDNFEGFIQETVRLTEEKADKYGYTLAEVTSKNMEYAEDEEMQGLAMHYVNLICPEIAAEVELQS